MMKRLHFATICKANWQYADADIIYECDICVSERRDVALLGWSILCRLGMFTTNHG